MKLRNFLYLNTKIIEDYLSAIDGYVYDEESQAITNSSENGIAGKTGIKAFTGERNKTKKLDEEVKRSVKISDASKFDKVFTYLQSGDEDEQVKYYEFLSEEIFLKLHRDDFLEVLVTARFSKMKELTDSVIKLGEIASAIQGITDQKLLDCKTQEAINGFSTIGQLRSGKGISCVFDFEDGRFPLVAYLDESYFRCSYDNFVGQSYMLCKVLRKIPKGESIKLDEMFEDVKNLQLNRKQRRNLPKNMDNPDVVRDVVKGPLLIVIPIAVYQ